MNPITIVILCFLAVVVVGIPLLLFWGYRQIRDDLPVMWPWLGPIGWAWYVFFGMSDREED